MNSDTLSFGLEITLIGMGVVYVGLLLVTGAITLMRRLDERWQAAERQGEADALLARTDHRFDDAGAARGGRRDDGRRPPPHPRRPPHAARREHRLAWAVTGRAVLQGSHVMSAAAAQRTDWILTDPRTSAE